MKLCLVVYPLEIVGLVQALPISCSRSPPPKSTNSDQGPGKKDTFFVDRKEEKKNGRREKRIGQERRKEEKKKEGRKEGRQKKECKCVFRHFQFHVVDYLPPQSTNLDQRPEKK